MNVIQRLTGAQALALLTPYSSSDENSTIHLFLDVDDNDTLKGIFFDSNEVTKKIVRPISTSVTPEKYIMYIANISQTGGQEPTAKVLISTLGEVPTYSRDADGRYHLNTNNAFFDINKTFIIVNQPQRDDTNKVCVSIQTDKVLDITSYRNGALASDIFKDITLEIRVYK